MRLAGHGDLAGAEDGQQVAGGLGVPPGRGGCGFVGEDVGDAVAFRVEIGVLRAAEAVDPPEVLRSPALDQFPETPDLFRICVEPGVGVVPDDPQPGDQVGVGEEVPGIVNPDPPVPEFRQVEFRAHSAFPAGQVVQDEPQIRLMPGENIRPPVRAMSGVASFPAYPSRWTGVVGAAVGESAGPRGKGPIPDTDGAKPPVLSEQSGGPDRGRIGKRHGSPFGADRGYCRGRVTVRRRRGRIRRCRR